MLGHYLFIDAHTHTYAIYEHGIPNTLWIDLITVGEDKYQPTSQLYTFPNATVPEEADS